MAQDPGIGEERLVSGKGMQVGPADAHSTDAHQRLSGGGDRFGPLGSGKTAGFFQDNLQHLWGSFLKGMQTTILFCG
jgi:hypothetical protein